MAFLTDRNGKTVSVRDDVTGRVARSYECRNVQCAVTLHWKLTSDPAFVAQWVCDSDPKSPEVKRHGLERPMLAD